MGNLHTIYKNYLISKQSKALPVMYLDNSFSFNETTLDNKIKKINEGSYAEIYSINKDFVIKRIKINNSNYCAQITEIDILLNLKHKNIIKCFGFFDESSKLSFVLERYETTLHHYKPKNSNQINYIIDEISNGLNYMHKNKYLHLDLKPENILLKKSNNEIGFNVCICDFSISQKTKNLTVFTNYELITIYYRPYENLKGSCLYSDKSDLWSLGIISYELKTGIKICDRITKIIVDGEIDIKYSLLLFYDRNFNWNMWPPTQYDFLSKTPIYRLNDNDFTCSLDFTSVNENLFILLKYFPLDIINEHINETNLLYNKLLLSESSKLLSSSELEKKLISCFIIIYCNYYSFVNLVRYYNIYSCEDIYEILCITTLSLV